jgi:hypothetical protein
MWATCPRSISSGYHAEFREVLLSEAYQSVKLRTSSTDISGHCAEFQEGYGAVGEWQERGMVWQGNVMDSACIV